MFASKKHWLIYIAATAALSTACGDDDGFSTGVDPDLSLSNVSQEDAQAICDATESATRDVVENNQAGGCALLGAVAGAFGGSEAQCESSRTQCLAQPLDTSGEFDCDLSRVSQTCTLTVGQAEDCINDTLQLLDDVFSQLESLSCSELIMPDSLNMIDADTPASCAPFEAQDCGDVDFGVVDFNDNGS